MDASLNSLMDFIELCFSKIREINDENEANNEILKNLQKAFKQNKTEIIYKEGIKKKIPEYIVVKIPTSDYNKVVNKSEWYRPNTIWDEINNKINEDE